MSKIWSFFSISKQDSSRALCSECDANISRGKNSKTYSFQVAIADILQEMKEGWKISDIKGHLLIRDNAANIRLGAELANIESESCFIHTLQLALNDSIFSQRSIRDIIHVSRNIVGHFHHSPLATNRLKDIQNELGIPQHKLIQDVRTR